MEGESNPPATPGACAATPTTPTTSEMIAARAAAFAAGALRLRPRPHHPSGSGSGFGSGSGSGSGPGPALAGSALPGSAPGPAPPGLAASLGPALAGAASASLSAPAAPAPPAAPAADIPLPAQLLAVLPSIKETAVMAKLANMPVLRALALRPEETVGDWSRSSKYEAGLCFVVGAENPRPCSNKCGKGVGKFAACVSVPGVFSGACASCKFPAEAAQCEYYSKF
jgi:hypothetical protein